MLSTSASHQRNKHQDHKRLHGVPGVIYVLRNTGLKTGLLQIGLSRRSGWAKALELNRDKTNLIPGNFECVFEIRTQDGGGALELIFQALQSARRGRREQDFFEMREEYAEIIISKLVREADEKFQLRARQETALRDYLEQESASKGTAPEPVKIVREGIFKKAFSWMSDAIN
jgi:hypothetical protein